MHNTRLMVKCASIYFTITNLHYLIFNHKQRHYGNTYKTNNFYNVQLGNTNDTQNF